MGAAAAPLAPADAEAGAVAAAAAPVPACGCCLAVVLAVLPYPAYCPVAGLNCPGATAPGAAAAPLWEGCWYCCP